MSRTLWRALAALTVLALLAAACGNSDGESGDKTPTTGSDGTAPTDGGDAERDTFVAITGVPGVTDDEIAFAAIGTREGNPLGTCILDCYLDGIKAYFAFRNAEGGIFGRDLVLSEELDDALAANQAKSLEVISGGDAFGVFQATLVASGWGDLDDAGVPTYTWGIHATEAASRPHIFPSTPIRCGDCTGRSVPFAVKEAGATRVASLGYGISENSKVCAKSVSDAIDLYSADIGAEMAYFNNDLAFGLGGGIGPQVSEMKAAGVDFIATCIDLNGMKTLAEELARQDMDDVVLYHPNTYSQSFVTEADGLFEGDFVTVQFLPFEADSEGTALADFVSAMEDQGSDLTELAMVGWINASQAFDGLLAAGPEFDRDKVTAATNAMTAYDAGGLIPPVDWTESHDPYTQATREVDTSDECGALVRIENGKFVTVAPPETPWVCWPPEYQDWSEPEFVAFG